MFRSSPVPFPFRLASGGHRDPEEFREGSIRTMWLSEKDCNIIYERIVKRVLQHGIAVAYNPDLPEAKALPTTIKRETWRL